eukprot:223431_1
MGINKRKFIFVITIILASVQFGECRHHRHSVKSRSIDDYEPRRYSRHHHHRAKAEKEDYTTLGKTQPYPSLPKGAEVLSTLLVWYLLYKIVWHTYGEWSKSSIALCVLISVVCWCSITNLINGVPICSHTKKSPRHRFIHTHNLPTDSTVRVRVCTRAGGGGTLTASAPGSDSVSTMPSRCDSILEIHSQWISLHTKKPISEFTLDFDGEASVSVPSENGKPQVEIDNLVVTVESCDQEIISNWSGTAIVYLVASKHLTQLHKSLTLLMNNYIKFFPTSIILFHEDSLNKIHTLRAL